MAPARTEDQQIQAIRVLLGLGLDAEVLSHIEKVLLERDKLRQQLATARFVCQQLVKALRREL